MPGASETMRQGSALSLTVSPESSRTSRAAAAAPLVVGSNVVSDVVSDVVSIATNADDFSQPAGTLTADDAYHISGAAGATRARR